MIERDWHGCYKVSWKGVIVDEAFAHPAKFSRGLIRRIYRHAIDQGWLEHDDTVVDPFGGVALGALQAMRHGLHWYGCELEPRFVDLGNRNIHLWNMTYSEVLPTWGTALLLNGDSRELARMFCDAAFLVSSPPFAEQQTGAGLANVSERIEGGALTICGYQKQGTAPGQLGAMPAGEFAAAVSSPPFESSLESKDERFQALARPGRTIQNADYGTATGQLGQESGNTFWTAARAIVEQTYTVLRPGAVAIWVTKSFVRNKQRVDFPGQWLQLCEAVGFERLEWIRAWLVEDNGTQAGLFGEDKRLVKERKSFFRRLAEKNGSPPIDYEVVVVVRKP